MQKRSGKSLLCLLGAFFLLLILSALVEAPTSSEASEASQSGSSIVYHAEFLPCTVPLAENSVVAPPSPRHTLSAVTMLGTPMAIPTCKDSLDANGHWVQHKRYAHSVYQVFRLELAGG